MIGDQREVGEEGVKMKMQSRTVVKWTAFIGEGEKSCTTVKRGKERGPRQIPRCPFIIRKQCCRLPMGPGEASRDGHALQGADRPTSLHSFSYHRDVSYCRASFEVGSHFPVTFMLVAEAAQAGVRCGLLVFAWSNLTPAVELGEIESKSCRATAILGRRAVLSAAPGNSI